MASLKKKSKIKESKSNLKLLKYNPRNSLKNVFWKSTLFNDIYLDQDIYRVDPYKWDIDGDPDFESCLNGLLNLFSDWSEDQLAGWTEADTVAHWIKPILVCLGWVDENKTALPHSDQAAFAIRNGGRLQTYFADILISDTVDDMSLYVDRTLTAEQRLEKAKGKVLIPLEAKYWNRINKQYAGKLNKKEEKEKNNKNIDAANRLGPNGQTLKYMEILELEWGILSDGATWRLFNKELSSESEGRYLEFNIYNLYKRAKMALESEKDSEIFREATKFFYNFFSKKALFPKEKKQELVRKALNESKSYADKVEEDLKVRFVSAMNIVCNGLKRSSENCVDINMIRSVAESHLFNILFIKSCESRNILPLNANQYWDLSLSRLIDALHAFDPDEYEKKPKSVREILDVSYFWFKYTDDGYEIFDSLIELTKMIHKGSNGTGRGFHIDGFVESIFSKKEWTYAKNTKLSNIEMVKTLFELGFAKAPKGSKRKYQEIPYQYFTPRQLGSIYESFLEYRIDHATEDLAYIKKQWKPANLKSEKVKKLNVPKVKKNDLFFTPDNKDKKVTGSYYTPDFIVQYIIKKTIGPLCDFKSSEEIKDLNICDPAMGSGHFLNGALSYLAKRYLEALEEEIFDDISITPEEAKRIILDSCIFGVDINPRAVKLAKMSLWLESAHPGKKLERLDDQLMVGNSLISDLKGYSNSFNWNENIFVPKEIQGFDAIIGNPPYLQLSMETYFNEPINNYILETYSSSMGRLNTFGFFVERSFKDLTAENGNFGMIIPNTILTQDYYEPLRKLILNKKLNEVVIFDDLVFKGAVVETTILIVKNTINKKNETQVTKLNLKNQNILSNQVGQELFLKQDKNIILTNVDSRSLELKAKFDKFKNTLGKNFNINQAIALKGDRKKFLSETKKKSNYEKVIDGRNISDYFTSWDGKYLDYDVKHIHSCKRRDIFDAEEKVFFRRVGEGIIAAYDNKGLFALNTLIVVTPKETEISLKAILGFLNSKVVNYYYSNFLKSSKKVFSEIQARQVARIPLPEYAANKILWGNIEKQVELILNKGSASSSALNKIDNFVAQLYCLKVSDIFGENLDDNSKENLAA